jgi:hypothetical protein
MMQTGSGDPKICSNAYLVSWKDDDTEPQPDPNSWQGELPVYFGPDADAGEIEVEKALHCKMFIKVRNGFAKVDE